jgi:hypothetical protein
MQWQHVGEVDAIALAREDARYTPAAANIENVRGRRQKKPVEQLERPGGSSRGLPSQKRRPRSIPRS